MSKDYSKLFTGTLGDIRQQAARRDRVISAQNQKKVVDWAQKLAKELEAKSKNTRRDFNTATIAYDESTGKYYYGRNKGIFLDNPPRNPKLFGDESHPGILPKEALNRLILGNCAEVDAINKALNDGAELKNLHMTTIRTYTRRMGESKEACANCTAAFKGRIKRNYTGWHTEEK